MSNFTQEEQNKFTHEQATELVSRLVKNYNDKEHFDFYNTLKDIKQFDQLIFSIDLREASLNPNDFESFNLLLSLLNSGLKDLDFDKFEFKTINSLYSKLQKAINSSTGEIAYDIIAQKTEVYNSEEEMIENVNRRHFINSIKEASVEDDDFNTTLNNILVLLFDPDKIKPEETQEFSDDILSAVTAEAKTYFLGFFQNISDKDFFLWRKEILLSKTPEAKTNTFKKLIADINERTVVFSKDGNSDPFKFNSDGSISFQEGHSGQVDTFFGTKKGFQGRSSTLNDKAGGETDQLFRHPAKMFLTSKILDRYFIDNDIKINDEADPSEKFLFLKRLVDNKNRDGKEVKLFKEISTIMSQQGRFTYESFKEEVRKDDFFEGMVTKEEVEIMFSDGKIEFFLDQYSKALAKKDLKPEENEALAFAYIEGQKVFYKFNLEKDAVDFLFKKLGLEFLYVDKINFESSEKFLKELSDSFFAFMSEGVSNSSEMIDKFKSLKNASGNPKYSDEFLVQFLTRVGSNRDYITAALANQAIINNIDTDEAWVKKFNNIIGMGAGLAYSQVHNSFEIHSDSMKKDTLNNIRNIIFDFIDDNIISLDKELKKELREIISYEEFLIFYNNTLKTNTQHPTLINDAQFLEMLSKISEEEFLIAVSKSDLEIVKIAEVCGKEAKEIIDVLCNELVNNKNIMPDIKKKIIQKLKSEEPVSVDELFEILDGKGSNKDSLDLIERIKKIYNGIAITKNVQGKSSGKEP